jgi:hypothetical protein
MNFPARIDLRVAQLGSSGKEQAGPGNLKPSFHEQLLDVTASGFYRLTVRKCMQLHSPNEEIIF